MSKQNLKKILSKNRMQITVLTFPCCLSWSWIIPHHNIIFIVEIAIAPPSGFIHAHPINIGCTSITYKLENEKQASSVVQLYLQNMVISFNYDMQPKLRT